MALLLLAVACTEEKYEPDWSKWPDRGGDSGDTGGDTDDTGPDDTGPGPDPRPITIAFTGYAATVTERPFGMVADELRDAPCEGTFTYDLSVADRDLDDPAYGEFDHRARTGAFELTVAGHTLRGSGAPITEVHDASGGDLWRYEDGPQLGDETNRAMEVDGVTDPDAELWVSIVMPASAFSSDAQPPTFPTIDFADGDHPHTFSLDLPAGTVLFQLYTLGPTDP